MHHSQEVPISIINTLRKIKINGNYIDQRKQNIFNKAAFTLEDIDELSKNVACPNRWVYHIHDVGLERVFGLSDTSSVLVQRFQ